MSEYQKQKALALELQKKKEAQLKREIEEKAERDKQKAKDDEQKRQQREAAAKEARKLELMRANEALSNANKGSTERVEYNPFAEDERRPVASSSNLLSKTNQRTVATNGTSSSRAGPSKPRADSSNRSNGRSNGKSKEKESTPPLLGRKEKAARSFAQKALKSSANDSIFSVRSLVDQRAGSGTPPRVLSTSAARPVLGRTQSLSGINGSSKVGSAKAPSSGRKKLQEDLKKTMGGDGLRVLCPDRTTRDRRTIDQIQKDIKARKGISDTTEKRKSSSRTSQSRSPVKQDRPISRLVPPNGTRDVKRRRSPSTSDSYESDSEDNRRPRKSRGREEPDPVDHSQVSAMIREMFQRPGRPAPARYADSDDGSDMEAGLSDVEEEERRAAAIARREDERAEREEKERKAAKEKAKKERLKGR